MFGKKKKAHLRGRRPQTPCVTASRIAAVSTLILQLVVFCMVGGYADTFHILRGYVPLPPLWLFTALDWLCCALGGGILGKLLFWGRLYEKDRFRCAFFAVLALMLGYFWHALFFGARAFLLSMVFAALALLASLAVWLCPWRGGREGALSILWSCYAFYRLLLSFFCLFSL